MNELSPTILTCRMHRLHLVLLEIVQRNGQSDQPDMYKLLLKQFNRSTTIDIKYAIIESIQSIPLPIIEQANLSEIVKTIMMEMRADDEQIIVELSGDFSMASPIHLGVIDLDKFRTKIGQTEFLAAAHRCSYSSDAMNAVIPPLDGGSQRQKSLIIEFDFDDNDDEPMNGDSGGGGGAEELLRRATVDVEAIVAAYRRGELNQMEVVKMKRIFELLRAHC